MDHCVNEIPYFNIVIRNEGSDFLVSSSSRWKALHLFPILLVCLTRDVQARLMTEVLKESIALCVSWLDGCVRPCLWVAERMHAAVVGQMSVGMDGLPLRVCVCVTWDGLRYVVVLMESLGCWRLSEEMNSEEDGEIREKVEKYTRMLSSDNKVGGAIIVFIGHALRRLAAIDMTLELLSETGVGKAVNQLRSHEQYGAKALRIVEKWKEMARSCGLKQRRKQSLSPNTGEDNFPEKPKKENCKKEKENKDEQEENSISEVYQNRTKPPGNELQNPYSGLSFADMLARADAAKPCKLKKMKSDYNDWKLSKIDVNYKPSKVLNFEPIPREHQPTASKASVMDVSMFKPRKSVRKIYAGRPRSDAHRGVSTLQNLCIKVLIANINSIEEVGDTPYFLLKPVLEKCSLSQLCLIERRNPQLMEDSDELWERIVNRTFPKCETADDETWRECYYRLCEENERKLKMLSTKITQHNREATAPVKTALLADAKAPREIRRRQMRFGTQHTTHPLPSANEISKARKEIFDKGNKEALANLPQAIRNTGSSLGAPSEKKKMTPKKGVLMMKTLRMLNVKRRK
uniref:TFIIS N-terminal domain-containing protein n=1 Tax=Setaria digitata TaxID=48799 RepID=A0A915Q5F6_9BILA